MKIAFVLNFFCMITFCGVDIFSRIACEYEYIIILAAHSFILQSLEYDRNNEQNLQWDYWQCWIFSLLYDFSIEN